MTAAVLLALMLTAQEPGDALGPCAADAAKLCVDVPPGHGAKMKCLNEHEAELGPGCKERIAAVKKRIGELVGELQQACGDDAKKLCAERQLGTGLLPCLTEHERDLSESCHHWIAAHQNRPGAAP